MASGRLCIATPLYPPDPGGPATYARVLETGLPPRGVEVALVKFGDVRRLPKLVRHFAYAWRVWQAARSSDAILALDPVSVGLPALVASVLARKPLLLKLGGDYAWEQGVQRFGVHERLDEFVRMRQRSTSVRLLQWIERTVARHAAVVIVPSEYLKGVIIQWGRPYRAPGIHPERIRVIYNAMQDIPLGTVPDEARALSRPRIVSVGRLVPWKGMGGIVDAVVALREDAPEATLAIAGDGPDFAHLTHYMQARLGGSGLLTGPLPHADALALMQHADLFILNSSYEGLSHLLIEAQALGVPTIATDAGGNAEVITDGTDGVLVPVGDRDALAGAMRDLLSDGERRAALAAAGKLASARFSEGAMVDAIAGVFRESL